MMRPQHYGRYGCPGVWGQVGQIKIMTDLMCRAAMLAQLTRVHGVRRRFMRCQRKKLQVRQVKSPNPPRL